MNEREIRSCESSELRMNSENRTIEGTAILFNTRSKLLTLPNGEQFYEEILPEAISEEVLNRSDIHAYYNHDKDYRLARRKYNKPNQSLDINITETGVNYSFRVKDDVIGEEFLEDVNDGDIVGSSFAFKVANGGDTWSKLEDGIYLRTINSFDRLFDVSPCSVTTAYDTGSVSCRSFDEFKEEEQRLLEEAKRAEQEKRELEDKRKELETYFINLKKSIN